MTKVKQLLLMAGLALSTPLLAQEVHYTTLNWPPYIGETEDRQGVLAEIVKQTMAKAGTDYTLEFTSWTQALKDGEAGTKDAVVGAYYSEERAAKYYFSLPIYSVFTGLVKLDTMDVEFIKSYDELNAYRISKLADSVIGDTFDEHPFPHMNTFTTENEAVTALFNNDVDFYAGTLDVAKSVAKSTGKDSSKLSIVLPPINEQEVFVMFSRNTANGLELRDAFNKALISLQASGEYDQIVESFK